MAESLVLTFAELQFLVGSASGWSRLADHWGLAIPQSPDELAAAGLAGLVAREQATVRGDAVELGDEAAGVAATLEAAVGWITAIHVWAGGSVPIHVGYSADHAQRVMCAPVGAGCFQIARLRDDAPLAGQLAGLVIETLIREGDSTVFVVRAERQAIALTVDLSGRWTGRIDADAEPTTLASTEAARSFAISALERVLDAA